MSRWKYPFHKRALAHKFLSLAEKETGRKCFVRQVSIKANIFKIFSSEEEYKAYQNKKLARNGH